MVKKTFGDGECSLLTHAFLSSKKKMETVSKIGNIPDNINGLIQLFPS